KARDRAGKFIWRALSEVLIYSALRIPEISDDILNIDNAMKWGFNWELGPFETWDALGVEVVSRRLEEEGKALPDLVQRVLATDEGAFYVRKNGRLSFFDLAVLEYKDVPYPPGILWLANLKDHGK